MPGIPVLCECGRITCHLPTPQYDHVTSLPIRCRYCGGISEVTTSNGRITQRLYKGILKQDEVITIDMQSNVPEASALIQEAVICVNNGAFRGAAVMARGALEVALHYASFDSFSLSEKAFNAVTAEALTDYDYQRAENVRLIGNFGAHGSCAQYVPGDAQMNENDAKYIVELSSELVQRLIAWRLVL